MADKKSFVMYDSWLPLFETLSAEDAGKLMKAICAYRRDPESRPADVHIAAMFEMIRQTMEEDTKKYTETCQKRAEMKRAEWEARKEENKTAQKDTSVYKCTQGKTKSTEYESDNEYEYESDNDSEKDNGSPTGTKVVGKRAGAFTPPTVAEVQDYCRERSNNVDPERFVNFYASKGWYIGKNKMKDWRAAVRTWEKERAPTARSGTTQIDEWAAALREVDG